MGYFSKSDSQGDVMSGGSGSWAIRTVKKLFYATVVTIVFGIYKAGVSGRIIDIGIKNGVPYTEIFQVAFIKALQKGTLDAPDMLFTGITQFTQFPISSIFRNFVPFLLIYGVWFQITSIAVDIIDGRRNDSVGFLGKALFNLFVMLVIWSIYTGVAFLDPTPLSFNATEVAVNNGWINQTVNASQGVQ